MMFNKAVPPAYITFEDSRVWTACCNAWGDHNKTVVTDNGDNTVNIVTTFESMLNTTVAKTTVVTEKYNIDNSSGEYVEGTTYEPIGITKKQCEAVTSIATGFHLRNLGNEVKFNEFRYFTKVKNISGSSPLTGNIFTEIKFPISLTAVDIYYTIFKDCKILDFPVSATVSWFYGQNIPNAEVLILRNPSVQNIGSANRTKETIKIYVPNELVNSYKENTNWTARASNIYPIEGSDYEVFNNWDYNN